MRFVLCDKANHLLFMTGKRFRDSPTDTSSWLSILGFNSFYLLSSDYYAIIERTEPYLLHLTSILYIHYFSTFLLLYGWLQIWTKIPTVNSSEISLIIKTFSKPSTTTFFQLPILTRRAMYVQSNIEASSCNHCCSIKTISITYSVYVFGALGIQHAMRTLHMVMCGLSFFTTFFHIFS
jgi:hypothetical protein